MNERIKQLESRAWGQVNRTNGLVRTEDFNKKFAELIVRECGQYLNSPEFIGRSDLDWSMVLNEHFGVEE
jgi:hypothetical protein